MDLDFTVKKYDTSEKLDEDTGIRKKQVRVTLGTDEGHRLTLVGDESIKKGFPLNDVIAVHIETLKTLEEFSK